MCWDVGMLYVWWEGKGRGELGLKTEYLDEHRHTRFGSVVL